VPSPLEAEISSLLQEHGDTVLVAEVLVSRWRKNLFTEIEQIDCAQFLIAAGLYPMFFAEIIRLMEASAKLPWAQLAEGLGRSGIKLHEYDIQAILDAAELQNATTELLKSHQLDLYSRTFGEKRKEDKSSFLNALAERKQALKDKLHYMRSNRMFDQELMVLQEFEALFPDEPEIQIAKEAYQLRWARDVVANSTSITDATSDIRWRADRLSPEQISSKHLIIERAKELAHENPALAYDLAIALQLMDFHADAIEVLKFDLGSRASDWLRLELMIKARQFVSAMEEANHLELQYAGDPESVFSVTYARARAFHGLGQTLPAIDLLRSLIKVRPNYKSAQSLLADWAGGDE